MKDYNLTQEEVASRIGKSRSAIANTLRLLRLPDEVRDLLAENSLNPGHARALLGLEEEKTIIELARLIVQEDLSVRQVENLVKKHKEKKKRSKNKTKTENLYNGTESRMEEALGTRVNISLERKGIIGI